MSKSVRTIVKLNLKNIKTAYAITFGLLIVMFIQDMIKVALAANGTGIAEESIISSGNYIWLLVPLAAIFIATMNFRKILNLGGKRRSYFVGCLITYLILAIAIALVSTVIYYTYDRVILETGVFIDVANLVDIWGWTANGPVIAFLQQAVALFLFAVFIHTMTLLQEKWYGWVVDVVIAIILAVFLPIEPLRMVLYNFFELLLFHPNAMIQMITCVVLAVVIYAISYPVLNKKRI